MRPQAQLPSTFIFITVTHISSLIIPIVNTLMLSALASLLSQPVEPQPGRVFLGRLTRLLPRLASRLDGAAGRFCQHHVPLLPHLLQLGDVKMVIKTGSWGLLEEEH